MTRVRLPPDPHTACITTIVDSQGGDAALIQAVSSSLQQRTSEGSFGTLLERTASNSVVMANTETAGTASILTTTPPRNVVRTAAPDTPGSVLAHHKTEDSYTSSTAAATTAGPIENIDSIVLVYDLDRVETFFRLENHWLPLIERCYGGKVRY